MNSAKIVIDTSTACYIDKYRDTITGEVFKCKKASIVLDQEEIDLYKYEKNKKIENLQVILDGEKVVFSVQDEINNKILKGFSSFLSDIEKTGPGFECISFLGYILNKDVYSILDLFQMEFANNNSKKNLKTGDIVYIKCYEDSVLGGHAGLMLSDEYILSKVGNQSFSVNHLDEIVQWFESSRDRCYSLSPHYLLDVVSIDFNYNKYLL